MEPEEETMCLVEEPETGLKHVKDENMKDNKGFATVGNRGKPMPRAPTLADFLTDGNRLKLLAEDVNIEANAKIAKTQERIERAPSESSVQHSFFNSCSFAQLHEDDGKPAGPRGTAMCHCHGCSTWWAPQLGPICRHCNTTMKVETEIIFDDVLDLDAEDFPNLVTTPQRTSNQADGGTEPSLRPQADGGRGPALQRRPQPPQSTEDLGVQGAMGVPAEELPSETPQAASGTMQRELDEAIEAILKRVIETGVDDELAESLKCLEIDTSEEELMALGFKPKRLMAALDSGAGEHVAGPEDVSGLLMRESAGSKAGRAFIAANGSKIPNLGEVPMRLRNNNGPIFQSVFQIADVTRPLYSVGRICDAGCEVTFTATKASVLKDGKLMAVFERQSGLYLADLEVLADKLDDGKPASGFPRQGAGS